MVDELALGRDSADPSDGLGDRHATDLVVLIADHMAELLFDDQLDGADAEAGSQDPVEGRGVAYALS